MSLWILLVVILMALGTIGRASARAKSAPVDDAVIGERVKTAINHDVMLRRMEIGVTVQQKVVYLSGFVSSPADVAKTQALASAVRGVIAVRSAIRVERRRSRA